MAARFLTFEDANRAVGGVFPYTLPTTWCGPLDAQGNPAPIESLEIQPDGSCPADWLKAKPGAVIPCDSKPAPDYNIDTIPIGWLLAACAVFVGACLGWGVGL